MPSVFQVVLQGTYFGEASVNVFSYVVQDKSALSGGVAAGRLLNAMGYVSDPTDGDFPALTIAALQQLLVNPLYTFSSVYAFDQYDPADFQERAFVPNTVGRFGGAAASSVLAYGFRTTRINRAIRRGTKRFVGVNDEMVGDDNAIAGAALAAMSNLASAMGAVLDLEDASGAMTEANPAVFAKEKYTTPSGKTAYKFYDTALTQLVNTAQGIEWEIYPTVRTQVSRQTGRGI